MLSWTLGGPPKKEKDNDNANILQIQPWRQPIQNINWESDQSKESKITCLSKMEKLYLFITITNSFVTKKLTKFLTTSFLHQSNLKEPKTEKLASNPDLSSQNIMILVEN